MNLIITQLDINLSSVIRIALDSGVCYRHTLKPQLKNI